MKSQLEIAGIYSSHDVKEISSVGVVDMMEDIGLSVVSMGRTAREDELFFESAAAAANIALLELEKN